MPDAQRADGNWGGGNVPIILEIRDESEPVGCPKQTNSHS